MGVFGYCFLSCLLLSQNLLSIVIRISKFSKHFEMSSDVKGNYHYLYYHHLVSCKTEIVLIFFKGMNKR